MIATHSLGTSGLVPLYNFDGFKFQRSITGVPFRKVSLLHGSLDGLREFKNDINIV